MVRLRRNCRRCEGMFVPDGKFCKFCDNCIKKSGLSSYHRKIKKRLAERTSGVPGGFK